MSPLPTLQTAAIDPEPDSADLAAALARVRAEVAELGAECAALRYRNECLELRLAQFTADLAEREEARLRAFQAQKMEAIGQLTGGIAHDFNNLLTVVSGGLHLLPGAAADPERRGRLIRRMEGAVGRGAEVTRRLLAFARRQILQPQVIDLRAHAAALAALLGPALGERVTLELRLADDLWPIEADLGALELSLLNIAQNAADAMRGGGTFTLGADNRRLGPREAPAAGLPAGDYVQIACVDTGAGMAPEVLARVFEPFFTTKPVGQGTGLGLPQVHGFASQSGGSAQVQSAAGAGTTVIMLLPCAGAACRRGATPS